MGERQVEHICLTIGELSERSGVASSALRYYEAQGLIGATRTTGNQRRYERSTLRRVAFIRSAQRVGLDLRPPEALEAAIEDRSLLRARDEQGPQPEVDLLAVAEVEVVEGAHRLERLQRADGQGLAAEECGEAGDGVDERAGRH